MKIAVVDPAAYSLAYDVPLCDALAEQGCDVTLYTTRFAHADMPAPRRARQVEHFYRRELPRVPRRMSRALQHPVDLMRLAARLRRDGTDLVHVQWTIADRLDCTVWRRLSRAGIPVVYTAHNAQERVESLAANRLRGFNAVVAHSDGGAANIARAVGDERTWRMRIGAYSAYAEAPDPPEPPVDLPPGPLAVQLGLLRPYKGVDVLLAAWPAVRRAVPDAQLLVAGRMMGIDLPAELPDGVHVLPRFLSEPEYAWALRRAAVCCLPYRRIDMSGVAASALACGTPLVASDVGGFSEYASRGALLVPPGDPTALADSVAAVLGDEQCQRRLSDEALTAVRDHYSWSAIAAEYVERYRRLLSAAEAPSRHV